MSRITFLILISLIFLRGISIAQIGVKKKPDKDTLFIQTLISNSFKIKSNHPDSAIYFATKAIELTNSEDLLKWKARALIALGSAWQTKGEYSKALSSFKQTHEICVKIKNLKGQSAALGNIGSTYFYISDYEKALAYQLQSLKIDQSINNEIGIGNTLSNIGNIYLLLNDYSTALDYQNQSLIIQQKIGNSYNIANTYNNIGIIFEKLKENLKSLDYHKMSLNERIKIKDKIGQSNSYINLSILYQKLSKEDCKQLGIPYEQKNKEALLFCLEGIKAKKEINNQRELAGAYGNLGSIYLELEEIDSAKKYLFISNELSKQNNSIEIYKNSLLHISEYYIKTKDLEKAMSYYKRFINLKDSMNSSDKTSEITRLQLRYEQDKKDAVMATEIARDKEVARLQIENQKQNLAFLENENELSQLKSEKYKKQLTISEIEGKQKAIELKNLQKERKLIEENLKQQKFIQKLMIAGSGLLGVFLLFVFFSLAKSRKANKLIAAQKTEVEKQKVIAEKQKDIAEEQKHLLQEKQTEIIESITYAKRLQEAILPPQAFIISFIPSNFILYKPKDIVAGDFYWAENIGDLFFIAAADSTGHGVPGAMVSVVCSNALNRSVKEFHLTETGKILDKTKELVVETFEKSTSEVKDGMDISLLCIDTKNKKVFWSGANNPLWYVCSLKENESHTELVEVKADKQPIGKTDKVNPFTTHEIEFKENTTFYLFTDGFADQFGGPNGKKFKYKPFAEILVQNVNKTPSEQSAILDEKFEAWKGELEQVDDVCIIGVKI